MERVKVSGAPAEREHLMVRAEVKDLPSRARAGVVPAAWLVYDRAVLELRPSCECCDRDLPPDSPDARICTYECTFCAECVEERLGGVCPNCGGGFERRPIRPAEKLLNDPASTVRVFAPVGCGNTVRLIRTAWGLGQDSTARSGSGQPFDR
jgi:uncharacterized protein